MHTGGEPNRQTLLRQGVEWVKARQDELVEEWKQCLAAGPYRVYQQMPEKRLHNFAALHVRGLIERLEHQLNFEVEQIKQTYVVYLERGLTFEELVGGIDLQHQALTAKVQRELVNSPQITPLLLNRVNYIVSLLKATLAAALIEYQSHK